ncbi:brahma-associated protein of 60 kDa [Condylostylus longicornis]|uniref:brahma-associated protein of 60 kDa n=1 Tax=Condylostylus longicornis TaxID=2530218 RepID=UPI00244E4E70|nr:brahma-associated protein of 60 kDa [Condylostylus longicornis]
MSQRYQPPPPNAPTMRPYSPSNFGQRNFSQPPPGNAPSSPSVGPQLHPPRPAGQTFQAGLRGSGSGPGGKRSQQESRNIQGKSTEQNLPKKKKKLADKILPQKVRDLVPESQAYMDLLTFERKLDATIMRKRLDIQEALKRPMKQKRKLRIFISNTFYPGKDGDNESSDGAVASWELRVEGRLLEDNKGDPNKIKRKFSSFFKSLVIELDKELYGPDNHLVEWHRTHTTQETDGFQVKRPGDRNVRCTILLLLDYQPLQFKLDPRLARLLGVHTQTRPVIISALWQYIKTHKLQDAHEREYINCDKYLEQIFGCAKMKFAEIPQRLNPLLHPPDPIVINHFIESGTENNKQTACYDIDVEVDDTLKNQMNNFLMSTASQQEIQGLDGKIHETVETINQLKTNREFFLSFAKDPQKFIHRWIVSQTRDLKTMTDVVGNPEEERRAEFYYQPWTQEAVSRYFFTKVNQKRAELEQALGIRNA